MKITYYGHSALLVEAEGKSIIIDPFLSGNPESGIHPSDIKVDAVLLTHAHGDHFGDTIEIAKANNCPVVAPVELANYCSEQGVEAVGMNIGGSHQFDGFKVKYTLAFHSSSLTVGDRVIYGGEPAGILLTIGGKTLYHAGDTALFGDMKIIGELNKIDIAALPIGDFFTMGPEDAQIAAKWIGAPKVLPMHYDTFPPIKQDVNAFCEGLKKDGIEGIALKNGESLDV
ncbi:metal-dependent hydrolase [Saccharibacillus sp. JS10]|uniref:metal-dependent hydrolase n=1 Tax=Saccharibacillus sp. JS10 TaxID=2950552 RepID=UPI00210E2F6C|nr:metal-dependent hydrolase [Saccharibacillus sp. JS10]MCQ4086696.1 metal-dependent hydrolase [Saccharibacillus sp. JS10]